MKKLNKLNRGQIEPFTKRYKRTRKEVTTMPPLIDKAGLASAIIGLLTSQSNVQIFHIEPIGIITIGTVGAILLTIGILELFLHDSERPISP